LRQPRAKLPAPEIVVAKARWQDFHARLAEALQARAVLGFQYGPPTHPQRELAVL
jgi:hypothetical protein